VGAGGAGGGDVEGGAGDLLVDGDVAGSGRGHGADDGEGMDTGVAGVELGGLGLLGLSSSAGAAYDDGDAAGSVVLGELGVEHGLAGGHDGELRGSVGGDGYAGVEVLARVEVFDEGGAGEAEALGLAGGFRVGREGRDAGGSGEESGAEVCDGVSYGGDTAEAGDYDTIHCFSLMVLCDSKFPGRVGSGGGCTCLGTPPGGCGVKSFIFNGLREIQSCKFFIPKGLYAKSSF